MTLVPTELEPAQEQAGPEVTAARPPVRELAEHAAVLLALVVWARVVTTRGGGRDDGALLLGSLALVPALLVLRPRLRDLRLLVALVVAALAVCLWAPYAFGNAHVVAIAACTGAAFAVARTYASTPERRLGLASALCLVSLDQFAQGFLAWWGGGDAERPMIGTFFWHNQYAAFLLPGAVLGSALAIFAPRLPRLVGFVSAPICFAGIAYSTSRATMLIAVGVLVVLVGLAALDGGRRRRLPLAAGLLAVSAAVLFLFTSPALFPADPAEPGSGNPLGGTAARAEEQSLGRNAGYRLDFWRAAAGEFADRPLVGGGFGSFGELSGVHLEPAATRTPSAHNELLQAFAEGGLVWGLVVLVAVLGLCIGAIRRLLADLRSPGPERAVVWGAGLAAGALLAHAAVDFDWSYPALAAMVAAVGGLVLALPSSSAVRTTPVGPTRSARSALAPAAVGCLALALGAQMAHAHERSSRAIWATDRVNEQQGAPAAAAALLATRSWFYDPRIDHAVLRLPVLAGVGRPLPLPRSVLEPVVERTERVAALNDTVNAHRAAVLLGLGRPEEALRDVREMSWERAHSRPATLQAYAVLLSLTGSPAQAREMLAGTVVLRAPEAAARSNDNLAAQLHALYQQLVSLAPASRELRCAGSALAPLRLTLVTGSPPLARATASDDCASLRRKGWP